MNERYIAILKKIPLAFPAARYLYRIYKRYKYSRMSSQAVFSHIYKTNAWGDPDSVSGPGSNLLETAVIRERLPSIFADYRVSSLLDVPCGDFHWMRQINLDGIEYIGGDIVNELIDHNKRYLADNVHFRKLDLLVDNLPKADLVLVRDCLVHMSNADVFTALSNICQSGSKYLLTTIFSSRTENRDIVTGLWRPLNPTLAPFSLPQPILTIIEQHPMPEQHDKSLGLWLLDDIRTSLENSDKR